MTIDTDIALARAIAQFEAFVSEPHDPPCGYRSDTQQLWPLCSGTQDHPVNCGNPGVHIELDMFDPNEPFVCYFGPFTLMTSASLAGLYEEVTESIIPTVIATMIHAHDLGYPCHENCCCDELWEEEDGLEE